MFSLIINNIVIWLFMPNEGVWQYRPPGLSLHRAES